MRVVAAALLEWPDSAWVTVYTLGNLVAGISLSILCTYTWQKYNSIEIIGLTVYAAGGILWSGSTALQILLVPYSLTRIFLQTAMVGVTMVTAGWLGFALAFTGHENLLTRKSALFLSIEPAFFIVLGSTNEITGHFLVWSRIEPANTFVGFIETFGIAFYAHTVYSYVVLLSGFLLVLEYLLKHRNVYRSPSLVVLLGFILVSLANISFIFKITDVDLTPIAHVLAAVMFFYTIFNYNITDLTPIARTTVWDELDDAVVTLDDEDRVVDANETAKAMFDVEQNCEGMPAPVFFEQVPTATLERLADATDTETEITAEIDGEQRYFSLSISPVDDERGQHGRVIVLQDITRLKQREQELDVLRQVQSRVLRHNIRTELSMVRGHAQMVAAEVDEEQQERMENIVEAGDRLATISDKARIVEELFEDEQSPREYDIRGSIDQAVANVRAEYPQLSISVTGANECQAKASPHLQTAVENLLENAAIHNDSDQPEATVHLKNGSSKELTISDNGPGIPEQELTVLEKEGEDALEHGSGLGLWLVKWIADRSDADLAFETGAEGTAVSIQFS